VCGLSAKSRNPSRFQFNAIITFPVLYVVSGQRIWAENWIDGTGQPQASVYTLLELPAHRQRRTAH